MRLTLHDHLWRLTQLPRFAPAWYGGDAKLDVMTLDEHPSISGMSLAMLAAARHRLTWAEQAWLRRIEAAHQQLRQSQERLPMWAHEAEGRAEETVRALAGASSRSGFWGRVLLKLVRHLRPATCLELGTCLGLSTAHLGAGLRLNRSWGAPGRLLSIEGSPGRAGVARRVLDGLDLGEMEVRTGFFEDELGPALADLGLVDFVFIDDGHYGPATVQYVRQVQPHLAPGAVVLIDDIAWSPGMQAAWQELRHLDGLAATFDFYLMGALVFDAGYTGPKVEVASAYLSF